MIRDKEMAGIIAFVASLGVLAILGLGLWTERNLEFWLAHYKGVPVDVPFWAALVLSVAANGVAVIGNIFAEIARISV
jgi:hypothetical protein